MGMDEMDRHGRDGHRVQREELIPKHGGYRKLRSFQVARLAHDVTVRFCDRYIDRRSRTRDQMIQAARSGVQNIAEGSQASGTSRKTELRLTSVARWALRCRSIPSIPSIPSIRPTFPEIAANGAHALVGVACALLDRQIAALARAFEVEGGFTERLYRFRSQSRKR